MQYVYQLTSPEASRWSSANSIASSSKQLLQAVWWVSRKWVVPLAVDDPLRLSLIHLGLLSDDLVRACDYSPAAMTAVQNLLCANCRRINAAQETCCGQSLERCPLLNAESS